MDKCNTCGLERDKHTQLPHRFVVTPPNPDQGVLFDMDSVLGWVDEHVVVLEDWQKNYLKATFDWDPIRSEWLKNWNLTQPNLGFKFEDRSHLDYSPQQFLTEDRIRMYYNHPRGFRKTQFLREWIDDQEKESIKRVPPSEHQLYMNRMAYAQDEFVPKKDRMQAKDIPEDRLIKLINDLREMDKPTHLAALSDAWPLVPYKVIQAKLRRLERKHIIEGCYCGCSTQNRVLTNAEKESRFQLKREEWLRQIQSTDETSQDNH